MNHRDLILAFIRNQFKNRTISVGWILCGNEQVGSSRIHGINLHKGLLDLGVRSFLLRTPNGYVENLKINTIEKRLLEKSRFDVVIFQRVYGKSAVQICRQLRKNGTICAFFMADLFQNEMLDEVDIILTPSEYLRDQIISRGIESTKVFYIPDAVETPIFLRKKYYRNEDYSEKEIKVVWVGAEGHWHTLDPIRKLFRDHPKLSQYRLITISNHSKADIQWNLKRVWNDIISCDIGIVPVDLLKPESKVKSNNRVTMFMALAMPVVCSPLPSYIKLIEQGVNGFIASTIDDWALYLELLKDVSLRKKVGESGFEYAHREFNIEVISKQVHSVLKGLVS